MFSLRQTWNDVFPPQKLYTLDVKVNCMDPGWPITQKVSTKTPAIHVNPNFFKSKVKPTELPSTNSSKSILIKCTNSKQTENEMQAQLQIKQRELLELKKRKLELELAATQKHIEEKEKQLGLTTATVATTVSLKKPEPLMKPDNIVVMPPRVVNNFGMPQVCLSIAQ